MLLSKRTERRQQPDRAKLQIYTADYTSQWLLRPKRSSGLNSSHVFTLSRVFLLLVCSHYLGSHRTHPAYHFHHGESTKEGFEGKKNKKLSVLLCNLNHGSRIMHLSDIMMCDMNCLLVILRRKGSFTVLVVSGTKTQSKSRIFLMHESDYGLLGVRCNGS